MAYNAVDRVHLMAYDAQEPAVVQPLGGVPKPPKTGGLTVMGRWTAMGLTQCRFLSLEVRFY